jgi:cell division cycle protein 20 (cofactor of APC complex)
MNEHLNDFNKMIADLKNLDVEIDDEDKALLLLNSLPDTYEHLVTILLYGKGKIKFIDVSNALVNNEYRKDRIVHSESTSEALTVRGRINPEDFEGEGDLAQNPEENHQTDDILQKISVTFVTKKDTRRKKIVQARATRKKMNQL